MKFSIAVCFAVLVVRIDCENKKLQEVFSWKIMDYAWKTPEDRQKAIDNKDFIPENNLILGLDRWKNKLFVTVPRWKAGVMSTLNYINISEEDEDTPKPPDVTAEPPPPTETTEPPPETTEPPPETTEPPPETTEPPPETTEPPPETTEPPPETTEPPPETTEPPPETTEPPPETTEPPPETTEPPPETTEPPPETTEPPPETTEPPPETTEPPEDDDDDDDPPPTTTEAPPPEEDDEEEEDEEEEEEPDPEPSPSPEEPVISAEDDARNAIASMRRFISNFDYVDPKTLSRSNGDPTTPLPPNEPPRSPALIPYPSFEANYLKPNRNPDDPSPITSVFRVRVDPCDRLWVMDSGVADLLGKPEVVVKPRILIYDLKTDKLIKEYKLKDTDTSEHSFFANIIVDVTADTCDKAFAYLPDLGGYSIVVYDFANDKSWKISHNYFHFDPLAGNMIVGGVNFQWSDGVFSIALTKPSDDGFRTAYFHALASTKEFKVSTKVMKDEEAIKDSYYEFKLVGDRGEKSQSSSSVIDEPTGVMFYTQLQTDSVNCWNTNKKLLPENLDEVASDNETMIFTNDMKVDYDGNLWVLTDKLPIFIYKGLDPNEINYRIFTVTVKDAIAGTKCVP